MPWPSSSRIASPLKTPSFHAADAFARLALGPVEDLPDGLEHGLEPVVVHQLEQPPLADAGRARSWPAGRPGSRAGGARWSPPSAARRPAARPRSYSLSGVMRMPSCQISVAPGIVGAVGGAADVVLVRAVDRPEHGRDRPRRRAASTVRSGRWLLPWYGSLRRKRSPGGDAALEEVGHRRDRPGQGAHVDRHVLGLGGQASLSVEHRGGEVAARVEDLRVRGAEHRLAHLLHDGLEAMLDDRDRDRIRRHDCLLREASSLYRS